MNGKSAGSVNYAAYVELNRKLDGIVKQISDSERQAALLTQRVVTIENHDTEKVKMLDEEMGRTRTRLHELEKVPYELDRLKDSITAAKDMSTRMEALETDSKNRSVQTWIMIASLLTSAAAILTAIFRH